jgi:hypothetical protein
METVAEVLRAFYRLTGSESGDPGLTDRGEAADEVAYEYLTRGCWAAQRFMLKQGYSGWRKRTSALVWNGSDATDGGRYADLPADFMRADGRDDFSCLVEQDGTQWGTPIRADQDYLTGSYFYFVGDQLWLTRYASPPQTLYLLYHYRHPKWAADVTIDFPTEALPLVVAEGANVAKEEDWLPERDAEDRIERALVRARTEALDIARLTKQPRGFRNRNRFGTRY